MAVFQIPENQQVRTEGTTMHVSRVFDAPRESVFKMYGPGHIEKWWMPNPWKVVESKMDFRAGGSWLYATQGPDNEEKFWSIARYSEITPPSRIAYEDAFADEHGNNAPNMPVSHGTIDFIDLGGKTEVRMTWHYPTEEALKQVTDMGMIEGLTVALNQLEELLAQ